MVGVDVAAGPETSVIGSVSDRVLIDRLFGEFGIEAVIHCGALHKPDIIRYPAQAFIDVNVSGTLNLLEAAVRAKHDRFVFTSSTSLMITTAIREEAGETAVWLNEASAPLAPRNIYGVTKLSAEELCRLAHLEHGLNCVVLRTSRFFPEEDDTLDHVPGPNLKANEFLNRRLTVEDAAEAHVIALEKAPALGFDTFVISAPPPFARSDVKALKHDASRVIAGYFPDAEELYARRNWTLPHSIGRVYDPGKAERLLGFRCKTDFAGILRALRDGTDLPFAHDPDYMSPKELRAR